MALKPVSFFEADATGTKETITLEPFPPASSTNAKMASAFYGTDDQGAPKKVPISSDGKSLTITVVQGDNPLVITIVSPNPNDESVLIKQGGTVLANPTVRQHSAVSTIMIKGT